MGATGPLCTQEWCQAALPTDGVDHVKAMVSDCMQPAAQLGDLHGMCTVGAHKNSCAVCFMVGMHSNTHKHSFVPQVLVTHIAAQDLKQTSAQLMAVTS